jgi:hypothetical protein
MRVRPGLTVREAEPKFQNVAIEVVEPKQQVPCWQRLEDNIIHVVGGMQPVQGRAVDKV